MKLDRFLFDGTKKCHLKDLSTGSGKDKEKKEEILERFRKNLLLLDELQNQFYADGKEGLVIALQALDAAGKDSLIRHVASGMNPQGVKVHCFKRPTSEELAHDYLWRVHQILPRRGEIAILNRSHYEDIITASVLKLKDTYEMADRVIGVDEDAFIKTRIRQVKHYEAYLYENSYRVIKVFLHVSKEEQKKRFLERIDLPEKNWKFEPADLKTREQFDDYMDCFERVIDKTGTKESPWYVLPADDKWYTRYLFSELLIKAIKSTKPAYPDMPDPFRAQLDAYRQALVDEKV